MLGTEKFGVWFEGIVEYLCRQLVQVWGDLTDQQKAYAIDMFGRAVKCERDFLMLAISHMPSGYKTSSFPFSSDHETSSFFSKSSPKKLQKRLNNIF